MQVSFTQEDGRLQTYCSQLVFIQGIVAELSINDKNFYYLAAADHCLVNKSCAVSLI